MKVTVLGSSSALPTSQRYPSAHVLTAHGRMFLIDCGEGTQMQLRKCSIRFGRINDIFISHLHGDHVFGLYGLLSTFNLMGRTNPIRLHAPANYDLLLGRISAILTYLNLKLFLYLFKAMIPLSFMKINILQFCISA